MQCGGGQAACFGEVGITPQRFRDVRQVFEKAMQLNAESRNAYIHKVFRHDTELLSEVERMVEHLGSGAFGSVDEVWDREPEATIAAKVKHKIR